MAGSAGISHGEQITPSEAVAGVSNGEQVKAIVPVLQRTVASGLPVSMGKVLSKPFIFDLHKPGHLPSTPSVSSWRPCHNVLSVLFLN
jgi:hypothetical protein